MSKVVFNDKKMNTTLKDTEISIFSRYSAQWWDPEGPHAVLHKIMPLRMEYLNTQIKKYFAIKNCNKPFEGIRVLDVGCGGGLTAESLARLGASVTAIDADETAIKTAIAHAQPQNLEIEYRVAAIEDLDHKEEPYDIVCALEIIEHVDNVDLFVEKLFKCCKDNGLVIFSTINRTFPSLIFGKIAAEYLLRWIPRGTHQWKSFIKPGELSRLVQAKGGSVKDITGMRYNVLSNDFELSGSEFGINYFMVAQK